MDAKEFLKCFIRYCNNTSCDDCVMIADGCYPGAITDIDRLIDKVEQWAKDYPVKTRQDEFLKLFPNARIDNCGILDIRPCCIEVSLCGKCDLRNCDGCRREYWLEEVTDND